MDDPDELAILITVPEEFAGFAMGELQKADGVVVNLNADQGTVAIDANMPATKLDGLAKTIHRATGGKGTVKRLMA